MFLFVIKNFLKNLKNLNTEKEILIEKYIPGREIQVAIMGNKKLGTIELVPKENFMIIKRSMTKRQKQTYIAR